jgi:hypothetical protein
MAQNCIILKPAGNQPDRINLFIREIMSELTILSPRPQSLKPLVQAALQNELRLLEAGLRRAQLKLNELERRYGLSTAEFIRRYENNEVEETIELAEWIGEQRLLERLQEKVQTLREVQFAD